MFHLKSSEIEASATETIEYFTLLNKVVLPWDAV